jgi:hypothetical protein
MGVPQTQNSPEVAKQHALNINNEHDDESIPCAPRYAIAPGRTRTVQKSSIQNFLNFQNRILYFEKTSYYLSSRQHHKRQHAERWPQFNFYHNFFPFPFWLGKIIIGVIEPASTCSHLTFHGTFSLNLSIDFKPPVTSHRMRIG